MAASLADVDRNTLSLDKEKRYLKKTHFIRIILGWGKMYKKWIFGRGHAIKGCVISYDVEFKRTLIFRTALELNLP